MDEKAFESYSLYDELKDSLEQAIAFKNGDKTKGRVVAREIPTPEYSGEEVRRLRKTLCLSQNGLALALGVSRRTVEAWEAGKNAPSNSSNKLLYLLENDNSLINQLISV